MYKATVNQIKVNSNYKFPGFEPGRYSNASIQLLLENDKTITSQIPTNLITVDNWFHAKHNEDFVFFNDTFLGLKNLILLKNLNSPTTTITFNKNVLRLDKIYPPRSRKSLHNLLHSIIKIKLIEKGYATLHAATLSKNNKGTLLLAFPNVGKTLSTLQLLKDNYKYLSDDAVHVHKSGTACLTKFPSAIGYNDFLKFIEPNDIGKTYYYKKLIKAYIITQNKLIERVCRHPHLTLGDIFNVELSTPITNVCVLELGPKKITEITTKELLQLRAPIDSYSLGRFNNPFLFIYDYFNGWSVEMIENLEKENVKQAFTSIHKSYRLSCQNWDWIEVIQEALQ